MPDEEIINDAEQEQLEEEKPTRAENRFKDLSEKVELTAKERDEAAAKAAALEKENQFLKGFSKVSSKYQDATEYQDKILEKYNAGYDMEDATISVLAKAGKLTNMPAPAPRQSPVGGSAATAMSSGGDKPISEMTHDEKREALLEIERESGGVTQMLRRGI